MNFLLMFLALTIAPCLPSVCAECCPLQTYCFDPINPYPFCFNCDYSLTPFEQSYCANGVGGCNFFACNCDDGCIKYDQNAWCVQPNADGDRHFSLCYISYHYRDWIKNPANWVNNTVLPTLGTGDALSSTQYLNSLISLIRPHFSNDPLTIDEFLQLTQRYFDIQNKPEALRNVNLEHEFAKLDLDNNGVIHLNEIDPDYH